MAYGRLRIDSPHIRSPRHHHRNQREGNDETGVSLPKPYSSSSSWSDFQRAVGVEQIPLLMDAKTATVGGAIAADRHLSAQMSTDSMVTVVPALIVWIGPALLCALAYALYNIFIKKGSASIHPVLGGVILQVVAAIFGTVLLGFIIFQQHYNMDDDKDETDDGLYFDAAGVRWAICAGIAVGLAEMLSFFVSSLGVQGKHNTVRKVTMSRCFTCRCSSRLTSYTSSSSVLFIIHHKQQCNRSQSSLAEVSCLDAY
jgi:uncharacterized membrane protein